MKKSSSPEMHTGKKTPIAVVGMAGLFPGALDLDRFWENIVRKVATSREIPQDRWIPELYHPHGPRVHPDKAYSTKACLIDDYRLFPADVNLDPELIAALDPLHHLVLGAGKMLFSKARLSEIARNRMGVCLAAIALPTAGANKFTVEVLEAAFEKQLFHKAHKPYAHTTSLSLNQCAAGRVCSYPAAILAKAFDIKGSSFTLDAACASSLYAVKIACDELQAGKSDAMIVGGVSRPDNIFTQVGFSQLRALSPSGRCAPFDETADGLVVGEGAGLMMLKRLEDAVAHNDRIYGIIKGIGLSNDMSGNLLAPDQDGQVRAMKSAYKSAGWLPTDVDLIECHGAGTPVGDMVELNSLSNLWKGLDGKDKHPTAIGSVKSMIGHLLTGAGAAGMIKTLLAFEHKTLPPSAHFTRPLKNSPLHNSAFKVQTQPEEWMTRDNTTPRRAAVSAFGFGGINGHLLLEEWNPENQPKTKFKPMARPAGSSKITLSQSPDTPTPIAIVGMGAAFGGLTCLREFQESVFKGEPVFTARPENRWRNSSPSVAGISDLDDLTGGFISELSVLPKEFHIPPNEIPDMLFQQILMLKIAAAALKDADMPLRGHRPNMGAIIGIGFDFETTDFYLRWRIFDKVCKWNTELGLNLTREELDIRAKNLMDAYGPPLTSSRTLGNLGSIVASRIAREFQFGGPSYTVSNEEASGLTALKLSITALAKKEIDTALVGAVDFSGDVRSIISRNFNLPYSRTNNPRSFDQLSDGSLPGEGSVALVLKRQDDALRDNHRIYAVINAMGNASSGNHPGFSEKTYVRSLENVFSKTSIPRESISFIETHGSGNPDQDFAEAQALNYFFSDKTDPLNKAAIGSLKPVVGHTGAVSGLASVVKSALCLYQEIIPPLNHFQSPQAVWRENRFYMPKFAQYWVRNKEEGPRKALAAAITVDGHCDHTLLEEMVYPDNMALSQSLHTRLTREKKKPLGFMAQALFVAGADTKLNLVQNLDLLISFVRQNGLTGMIPEVPARQWYQTHLPDLPSKEMVCIVAKDITEIASWAEKAKYHVFNDIPSFIAGPSGFAYNPEPLGSDTKIAFVYPGSGNHYLGMGRDMAVYWPEIARAMDEETAQLKNQMLPQYYIPWRTSWEDQWEKDAEEKILADAKTMIFGQVVQGDAKTRLIDFFGISPQAVIGYSLGQSVGYFATKAWPDKGEMLSRIAQSDLFTTQLTGPCESARKAWKIPENEEVQWTVAVVNRSAKQVKKAIGSDSTARLLIVNTYEQCVIGGRKPDVLRIISTLNCESVFLDGVVTVHCDAADPVADAYKNLHVFPVTLPENIIYYSVADGQPHKPTSQSAAESIGKQATRGFDFTRTIESAYSEGIRIYLEMGPHASCTGMIRSILKDRPHTAVSACFRGENDYLTTLKCLAALIAEHIPVNLDNLYGTSAYPQALIDTVNFGTPDSHVITLSNGRHQPDPKLYLKDDLPLRSHRPADQNPHLGSTPDDTQALPGPKASPDIIKKSPRTGFQEMFDFIRAVPETNKKTVKAHEQFLTFSSELQNNYAKTLELQTRTLMTLSHQTGTNAITPEELSEILLREEKPSTLWEQKLSQAPEKKTAFSLEDCLEFATGSIAKVLGPEFAVIDTYEKRVRLPDEPLMLVDRILTVEGEKRSLGSGRIVTEHDVCENAWYLDAGKAPVCISVEAGQADLFLCSYLGIDHEVKGKRAYRLLDATVEFHRSLPEAGDTIYYDITIDRFVKQGETYLFFFNFTGHIGNTHLITMTNGCAGFFTEEEVKNSGGIILSDKDQIPVFGIKHPDVDELVSFGKKTISDSRLNALRNGDLATCFGEAFKGITLAGNLRIPSGPMKLIDRIRELGPRGGRYGLGRIIAEADIHPDDWFLTCHFLDDMVMPGTLMYECCAHTFRVFLQQMGWITDDPKACYEPVPGVKSFLKCRGPVTPKTRQVLYEVEIKEVGYGPEPYAIADAHMYADGHRIVLFNDISLKLSNVTGEDLRIFWDKHKSKPKSPGKSAGEKIVFSRDQLEEFALGSPSAAFGDAYKDFDQNRFIARLPNPPFLLMDRVIKCDPLPWVLQPDGWMESVYNVSDNDWYFTANKNGTMPYVILLEIALQPCGWLAAYMGSALKSRKDLKFRNLNGQATLHREVFQKTTTLTVECRCTQVSSAGDMIIQQYDFHVKDPGGVVFEGHTTFGFFTHQALEQQTGLPHMEARIDPDAKTPLFPKPYVDFPVKPPVFPEDGNRERNLRTQPTGLSMPAKALLMIDHIDTWLPNGGAFGLGYIRGTKRVDPEEWFFKAHFFQDPVCPGSLGIESFLQLLKFAAKKLWGKSYKDGHFEQVTQTPHEWSYRGQITPENKMVIIEAVITDIKEKPYPRILANGYLKVDGTYIYEMKNYGLCIKPD